MALVDARQKLQQLRKSKGKKDATQVKDLRQLIKSKNRSKSEDRTQTGRLTIRKVPTKTVNLRDTIESKRRLNSRGRNTSQSRDNNDHGTTSRHSNRLRSRLGDDSRSLSTPRVQSVVVKSVGQFKPKKQQPPTIHYYVPPHLQQQSYQQVPQAQPTYIIAPPQSNLAMDNVQSKASTSILVSNLIPNITQSEILELFGDVGTLAGVCMIDPTTAIVAYQSSSDAINAVKEYHNRLLDGKPMNVNLMPSSMAPASNVRSRIGHNPLASSSAGQVTPMELAYGARR